jgi:hypothetical protein
VEPQAERRRGAGRAGSRYPRAEFVNFAFSRPTTLNHPEAYDTVVASGVEAVLAATAD